jgi:hypothetical protein
MDGRSRWGYEYHRNDERAVDQCIEIDDLFHVVTGNATGITPNAAWLCGNLTAAFGGPADVCVVWGPSEGSMSNRTCILNASAGAFSVAVSNLPANANYYYRAVASNDRHIVFAESTGSFGTAGLLPFAEPFDTRDFGVLDGQYGWMADPDDAAMVQASKTWNGSGRAVAFGGDATWHVVSGSGRTNVIWIDLYCQPARIPPTIRLY